jgi:hypothetical protein
MTAVYALVLCVASNCHIVDTYRSSDAQAAYNQCVEALQNFWQPRALSDQRYSCQPEQPERE